MVKTGSKMAARYRESIGDVYEEAMTEPGCGRRALCCLAKELLERLVQQRLSIWCGITYPFLTPSIWRSIHQTPGTPSISHKEAFLPKDPIGSHCKTKK